MVGVGDISIIIPLCCHTIISPNLILLLCTTRERAMATACGDRWGYCGLVCGG